MESTYFINHFLIAMPSFKDDTFGQSVVFLCEHDEDGAMGIIVNKPLNVHLGGVLEHLQIEIDNKEIAQTPVFMGGPVGQEHGFVIHTPYREDEGHDDLVISASRETLVDIAEGKGPAEYLITLGYAGWGPGQLETEINRNDWLIVPYNKSIIFETNVDQRWKKAAKLIGIDIGQLSSQVGHA